MSDTIYRQAAIDAVSYSLELCNKALDSITLVGRDRYAVEVERNSLLKLKDDINLLPSAEPEIIRCKDCKYYTPTHRCEPLGLITCDGFWCKQAERRTDG